LTTVVELLLCNAAGDTIIAPISCRVVQDSSFAFRNYYVGFGHRLPIEQRLMFRRGKTQ
jgi:hypothetical protein